MNKTIKIGTRKSALAMAQTYIAEKLIKDKFPYVNTEIVQMTTRGDKILDKPLNKIGGKGVFVEEFENALLNGEIDIAVHSGKDLPAQMAKGLTIGAVPKRADSRDVLVTLNGRKIAVGESQIVQRCLALIFNIRIKHARLELKITRQLFIATRQVVLQRADREQQMTNKCQDVVPDGTGQQIHRLLIPVLIQ